MLTRFPAIRRSVVRCIGALLVVGLASLAPAQITGTWVPLDDAVGAPDFPFGLNVAPDGSVYHIAIAGSFSTPNQQVAVLDRATNTIVARYGVGRFPEEIAYIKTGGTAPTITRMYVTDSSDGTVSVLDGQGNSVTTIPLGNFTFPFGIAIDQAQQQVAVTTKTGTVFMIDVNTNTVSGTIAVQGSHGRAVFLADGRLAFANSVFSNNQSTVFANIIDPQQVAVPATVKLFGPAGGFPSCEDVALVEDGRELWFPLLNADKTIHRIDASNGAPLGTISLASSFPGPGVGSLHGIASNDEGLVMVTDFNSASIALLRTDTATLVSTVFLARGIQPNDAQFSPDGREAVVTMQSNEAGVHVLTGLPTPRTWIQTTGIETGKPFAMTVRGAPSYSTSVIAISLTGDGPTTILGLPVRLSAPITPLYTGGHDARGRFSPAPMAIPAVAELRGIVVHVQALLRTPDLSLDLSDPLTLTIR